MNKLIQYFRSESTTLGVVYGLTFYIAYGLSQNSLLSSPSLLCVSICLSFFSPFYSRASNKIEEWICFKSGFVSSGRFGRFLFQFLFNMGLMAVLSSTAIIKLNLLKNFSELISVSFLTSLLSQGTQYIAISMANREIGNKSFNIIVALILTTTVTALSLSGVPFIKIFFSVISLSIGSIFLFNGILSDLRSKIFPKKGIAIFLGTFNPIHKTHLDLIRKVLKERNVSHVYLHPTVIPKLHRDALNSGEIVISKRDIGMRVYKKTDKADVHVNYFPTGNRFFEFETRCLLAEFAIREAGLQNTVTVLRYADIYEDSGFYGIIKTVKRLHPNTAIHGIHGSDLGGMWVRSIYDESGWIYPYSVKRSDNISATAIRNGAKGQTTPIVEKFLDQFKSGLPKFSINHLQFSYEQGILKNETYKA